MNEDILIIGLGGTNGAGKDTVGIILQDDSGFRFVSVTEAMRKELIRRGLPVDREHLRELSAEWRRKSGLGVLVDRALELHSADAHKYHGLVVGSLRNPGEADRVHELNGVVVWVDADPHVRYRRIQDNAHLRDRKTEDDLSFEEFIESENAEMKTDDEHGMHMLGVKEKSDFFIDNTNLDLEGLRQELDKLLAKIKETKS